MLCCEAKLSISEDPDVSRLGLGVSDSKSISFSTWSKIYSKAQYGRFSKGGPHLEMVSLFGHEVLVEMLIDKGADVNAQDGHYGDALQAASVDGHEQVVKMLLDRGADLLRYGDMEHPLFQN